MSKVLGRSLSFAAVSLVFASAIGCGVEADESGTETETASGALVAGQSFVVSFSGGGIPANASSLVTSAGGTIVARYNAVGAVLARSASGSFAATLRATPGIDAVGNAAAVHSSIAPVIRKTVKRPPHKHPPSAARRSAVVSPVGHGSDPRPAGARDHERQARRCWPACSTRASTSRTRISRAG